MKAALLTFDQVRARLNAGKTTVYLLLEKGYIRGLKIGNAWRVEEADLEAFINSRRTAAAPAVAVAASFDADDDLPAVQIQRFA